jgi:broad specificity phosphatase PhoE
MILSEYKGKTIAVVSHGDPIGILKADIMNKPFTFDFKMTNYLKTGQWAELICKDYVCEWSDLSL